uniref:Uncharacterized protein n=1 Tax=Tetranychus urticae TaxID=32264 RepID=T1JU17_TETUR
MQAKAETDIICHHISRSGSI